MDRPAPATHPATMQIKRNRFAREEKSWLNLRLLDRLFQKLRQCPLKVIDGRMKIRSRTQVRPLAAFLFEWAGPSGNAPILMDCRVLLIRPDAHDHLVSLNPCFD